MTSDAPHPEEQVPAPSGVPAAAGDVGEVRTPAGPAAAENPPHHRWALLAYALVLAASFGVWGVDPVLGMIAGALNAVFLVFFVRHLAFAISAARWAERDMEAPYVPQQGYAPHVAVFVGCKNEGLVVDNMVSALLSLEYPRDRLSIVVVDDGSTDDTGTRLEYWATRDSRLQVLHRPDGAGGGKSGALNEALTLVPDAEIVVVFDADHEPEPSVVQRLVRHFRDDQVGLVMGRCIIRNGVESGLASNVFVDFLSGYLVNEYGRQAVFELPAYGGANCAVRTSVLHELGGWNPDTVTEDTDLTLQVLLSGKRVRYDATAVDFEEAVVSPKRFWKQRYRWARGHQKCLRDYWWRAVRSPHLSVVEKVETVMFLWVYHVPVLCGLGIALTLLRVFGIGASPAFGFLPLTMLLFAGPLVELAVGLMLGKVERSSAWRLVTFLPSFAFAIVATTRAYIDGVWGRPYSWEKTARSGTTVSVAPSTVPDQRSTRRTFAEP